MAKSYYSTGFEQAADEVWPAVRAFDAYSRADRQLSAVIPLRARRAVTQRG